MNLSVITINYNNDKGLSSTFQSLREQTFKNFELIVIDGASNDGSLETINTNKEIIGYWVSEKDNGIYHAMNKGISKATGDYLFFLNSGDCFYEPNTLEFIVPYLNNNLLIYGNYAIKDSNKIITSKSILRLSDFWKYNPLCHQATIIHKSLFVRVGVFDEHMKVVADWALFVEILFKYNTSYTHIPITIATVDVDGLSSSENGQVIASVERKKFWEENFSGIISDYEDLEKYTNAKPFKWASTLYKFYKRFI